MQKKKKKTKSLWVSSCLGNLLILPTPSLSCFLSLSSRQPLWGWEGMEGGRGGYLSWGWRHTFWAQATFHGDAGDTSLFARSHISGRLSQDRGTINGRGLWLLLDGACSGGLGSGGGFDYCPGRKQGTLFLGFKDALATENYTISVGEGVSWGDYEDVCKCEQLKNATHAYIQKLSTSAISLGYD